MNILNTLLGQKEEVNYKELVQQGAIIVDVRSKAEFEGGHVNGAINMPLDSLESNLGNLNDKNKNIITCCLSGGRSSMAKSLLTTAGYSNVHNGGGWQSLQAKLA